MMRTETHINKAEQDSMDMALRIRSLACDRGGIINYRGTCEPLNKNVHFLCGKN